MRRNSDEQNWEIFFFPFFLILSILIIERESELTAPNQMNINSELFFIFVFFLSCVCLSLFMIIIQNLDQSTFPESFVSRIIIIMKERENYLIDFNWIILWITEYNSTYPGVFFPSFYSLYFSTFFMTLDH